MYYIDACHGIIIRPTYTCHVLLQVKGYARTQGNPTDRNYGDITLIIDRYRGEYLYDSSSHWQSYSSYVAVTLVCIITLCISLLVLLLTTRYLPDSLNWLQAQNKQTKIVYAITAGMMILFNCLSFGIRVKYISDYEYFYQLILPIMILVVITEVPIVMFYTCKNLPDCKVYYRLLLFFACCHTIWFIHRLAADYIIAVLNFITSPSQTIAAITIYLSIISATIITVRSMVRSCSEYGTFKLQLTKDHCKRCSSLLFALFTAITVMILVIAVTFLYVILVHYGLSTAGIGGRLFSFAPPLVALLVGLYIKRDSVQERLFKSEGLPQKEKLPHKCEDTSATIIQMDDNMNLKDNTLAMKSLNDEVKYTPSLPFHNGNPTKRSFKKADSLASSPALSRALLNNDSKADPISN